MSGRQDFWQVRSPVCEMSYHLLYDLLKQQVLIFKQDFE